MEVKIGVSDSPRELVFNSVESPEMVEHEIKTALADSAVLRLTDDKGRRFDGSGGLTAKVKPRHLKFAHTTSGGSSGGRPTVPDIGMSSA